MMLRTAVGLSVALALLAVAGLAQAACPGRLITLGGDITETVFALGAGSCVVADDTTSQYPPAAGNLPKVGYLRALNAEGVLSLRPDRIIASQKAGPPTAIAQIKAAGVEVVLIPEHDTVAGTIAKIKTVATALDRKQAGQRIIAQMWTTLDALNSKLAQIKQPQRVIFLLTVSGSPMAGGTGTAANGIIQLAGGINVACGFNGYKPLSAEAMVRLKPDVILVMEESVESRGSADFVYDLPGVKLTPAGKDHRVIAIDGTFMLGFGPRLGQAARQLAQLLYPNLSLPLTPTLDGRVHLSAPSSPSPVKGEGRGEGDPTKRRFAALPLILTFSHKGRRDKNAMSAKGEKELKIGVGAY